MPAPSFPSPIAALETLRPEVLGSLADVLAKVVGLPVEAALPPWLIHQAAGSAVVDHVLRLDPSLRRGQAIVQVAVANHWFRDGSFRRNTNRRATRRPWTEWSHNRSVLHDILHVPPTRPLVGGARQEAASRILMRSKGEVAGADPNLRGP